VGTEKFAKTKLFKVFFDTAIKKRPTLQKGMIVSVSHFILDTVNEKQFLVC